MNMKVCKFHYYIILIIIIRSKTNKKFIIGIDEAGRGSLAGPVVVASAMVQESFVEPDNLPALKDSKKMTLSERIAWFNWVKKYGNDNGVLISTTFISPVIIDKINISKAGNLAAFRSTKKLLTNFYKNKLTKLANNKIDIKIILDGGLFLLNQEFQKNIMLPYFPSFAQTIIKADSKIKAVQVAAIIAKVTRDDYMQKKSKEYLGFGFETHKGYGTKLHVKMIKFRGAIKAFHRKSFLKKILI